MPALFGYCHELGLTQVIGVRSFSGTQQEFIDNVSLLKVNAESIAKKLRP